MFTKVICHSHLKIRLSLSSGKSECPSECFWNNEWIYKYLTNHLLYIDTTYKDNDDDSDIMI